MSVVKEAIAVIGLGYVGLPVATALARQFPGTVGFDVDRNRIEALTRGHDATGEIEQGLLKQSTLRLTHDPDNLNGTSFFVVTVPTPIDENRKPDLTPLLSACAIIGPRLAPGAIVVIESTVYPGLTEEILGPALERASGRKHGVDFKLGYSPERINPGDREHTLERVIKVVSGEDEATLDRVAAVYGAIIPAGIHRAPSIRVAEAAKVIENTQRDLNIALMNELALIFDRMGINTRDVLAAAGTKWNFMRFVPGLVGGHCIGIDPYYLTAKAEALGYHPEVILAGRRINDAMGQFVAQRLVKLLIQSNRGVSGARVGVLGLTFKENVPDIRNSRVPTILAELATYRIQCLVHDPVADAAAAKHEYDITMVPLDDFQALDALILAVPHAAYLSKGYPWLLSLMQEDGVLIDVKSALDRTQIPSSILNWSL